MPAEQPKTYTIEQLQVALANLKIIPSQIAPFSVYHVLNRAFNPKDGEFAQALQSELESPSPDKQESLVKELKAGDRAMYLQTSSDEKLEALKRCISEDFRRPKYGESSIYSRAAELESELFFPRLYCVEIVSYHPHHKYYYAKVVRIDGKLEEPALACPPENLFVTESELDTVRQIYQANIDKSLRWLDEIFAVKTSELKHIIDKLTNSILAESKDSQEALNTYGLNAQD